ncbi:probable inactive receptor kinase At5g10020 [Typha angustifolia]|uniref:probable inactive receptor kinase At5g10020 n=1 Tax=Typha angustifolia TaxID=59011 RepID=UPI003C2F64CC
MDPFPYVLLLLFISVIFHRSSSYPAEDIGALLEFKKGIQSDPTGNLSSWIPPPASSSSVGSGDCPRTWFGITCESSSNSVVSLSLAGLGLAGDIKFNTLTGLRFLRNLSLAGNAFTGRLVPEIRFMTSLRHLDLSNNQFSGSIPAHITELSGLAYVNLSRNSFSEGFPEGFRNLQSLRVLDLRSNALFGNVSTLLPEFRNTEHVDLSGNKFYGALTIDAQKLSSLGNTVKYLNLSFNQISGGFFSNDSITIFKSLEVLDLNYNELSGELPQVGSLYNLKVFRVGNNLLSGSIPEDLFTNSMKLSEIDLSGNGFTGFMRAINSTSLKNLNLSSNALSGPLPSSIGKCILVDLSKNKLSGNLSVIQSWEDTLQTIDLSSNKFTGTYPNEASHFGNLTSLKIRNNSLVGSLPSVYGRYQKLSIIDLSLNGLSGELPIEISKLGDLQYFDISNNQFTGPIPDMPQQGLKVFNVSYNNLSGDVPRSLERFPFASFHPGNDQLVLPDTGIIQDENNRRSKFGMRLAFIIGSIGAVILVIFAIMVFYMVRSQELCGRNGYIGQATRRGRFECTNFFKSPKENLIPASMSFSDNHLLSSAPGSVSTEKELQGEGAEYSYADQKGGSESLVPDVQDVHFIGSQLSEQFVKLDVHSPDRLAGDLCLLDSSLIFTVEDLSCAPAEILGQSSLGQSYKATLDSDHVLTVKWLRVGLVKHKKEFVREAKRIGTIKHPNIISWRGYYWGTREQERFIVSDFVNGDCLSHHLYESTPIRYSRLSVNQRLKIAIDVARCLHYLHHDKGLPHGNLKPTNILLTGPDLKATVTDYGLHRLMTPSGTAEQILNLGALGYRAPELATTIRPIPSYKADIYSFGVIVMELLSRKSAGDIISGQSCAVDLTDWVQMCNREGRGTDCFDRDITGLEEAPRVMDELLAISLRCISPVNERPDIKTVLEDLCSITV